MIMEASGQGLGSSYRFCLDESVLVLVTAARPLFALSGRAFNHKIHAVLSRRLDGCARPWTVSVMAREVLRDLRGRRQQDFISP